MHSKDTKIFQELWRLMSACRRHRFFSKRAFKVLRRPSTCFGDNWFLLLFMFFIFSVVAAVMSLWMPAAIFLHRNPGLEVAEDSEQICCDRMVFRICESHRSRLR